MRLYHPIEKITKQTARIVAAIFIFFLFPVFPFTAEAQQVTSDSFIKLIDNREKKKEIKVSELKVDGFTYIYLKHLCEFYGIKYDYDAQTKKVILTKNGKSMEIRPNKQEYKIGKQKITMESPPIIINGMTAVPPKGMEEILKKMFDCRVVWRASSKKFIVNDDQPVTFWEDHPMESENEAEDGNKDLIKPGDILSISVWQRGAFELEELTREREVQQDGRVKFPFVGRITASNTTCPQLERQLSKMLESYIKNPEVTVTIKQDSSKYRVQLFGEVRNPGTYEFKEKVTLMEAVNRAGGFTDSAKLKQVRVTKFIHHSPYETDVVNCKAILYQGQRQHDVPVLDKDIVFVPKKTGFWGIVGGGVKKVTPVLSVTALVLSIIFGARRL